MILRLASRFVVVNSALNAIVFGSSIAYAAFLPIFGGPTYDSSTGTGYRDQTAPQGSSAGSGVAAGNANADNGFVAVRWDTSGTPATELENLGVTSNVWATNRAGTAVGVTRYEDNSVFGNRAVRWEASGAAATELGHLGTNSDGFTNSDAFAINDAGTAVGYALKFLAESPLGNRAVRWDASGTAATELGHIGTNTSGFTRSEATAINEVGAAVGNASKWSVDTDLGQRAVRWDVSGTATELGHIGTDSGGYTDSVALAINDAGTTVGQTSKFAANTFKGPRAVRWDASGTAATELGHLGTDSSGFTFTYATAINNNGTAIGEAPKYVEGNRLGARAVRWDASGTAATELGHLGTDQTGSTFTRAHAINDAGTAVGFAEVYDGSGAYLGTRAVMWGLDAESIELNTFIDPASNWVDLSVAYDITNDNWITGLGTFDPDGPGGLDEYDRLFLMHLPNPLPGDYNDDGIVDAADYVVWRRADGTEGGYQVWRSHFGEAANEGSASNAAVPEPTSFVTCLLLYAVAVCCVHTCNRRKRARHIQHCRGDRNKKWPVSPRRQTNGHPLGPPAPGTPRRSDCAPPEVIFMRPYSTMRNVMKCRRRTSSVPAHLAVIVLAVQLVPVEAAFLPIYGGPTYDSATGSGYLEPSLASFPGSSAGSGIAAGNVDSVGNLPSGLGRRAVRWDASDTEATVLGNLGTTSDGETITHSSAINDAGTAVGYAFKWTADTDTDLGRRAVRWDASGTAATELGNLGIHSIFGTNSEAFAINDAGTAVGYATKYVTDVYKGERAVRWDASGTAATELGHIGTDISGFTQSECRAINEDGASVGIALKFAADTFLGPRAVRWDASGTAATELGHLGTDHSGSTFTQAHAINDAGTAVGYAEKYAADNNQGPRAVRWDASGTAATELAGLGTDSSGFTNNYAMAINNSGTVIGEVDKYVAGNDLGPRAVRWDASGTAATELGHLGTDHTGATFTRAHAINDAGTVVGVADQYDSSGAFVGRRAVMWDLDGVAIDLNSLIDPTGGWLNLTEAYDISNDDWITGIGTFDPDGPGGLFAYDRLFLMHIPDPLPGDYNHDGIVDAADYVVWRKSDGTQASYDTWRASFGRASSEGSSAGSGAALPSTVPEPTTVFPLGVLVPVIAVVTARCRGSRFPMRRSITVDKRDNQLHPALDPRVRK